MPRVPLVIAAVPIRRMCARPAGDEPLTVGREECERDSLPGWERGRALLHAGHTEGWEFLGKPNWQQPQIMIFVFNFCLPPLHTCGMGHMPLAIPARRPAPPLPAPAAAAEG